MWRAERRCIVSASEGLPVVTIYTIGHSNHELEKFLALLTRHELESLVDVRSSPYSKYAVQFNRPELEYAVEKRGIRYVYLGEELGGRPPTDDYYDDEGHALYFKMATAPFFLRGIEQLIEEGGTYKTAFMCSEENPEGCHRHLLIARVLAEQGIKVVHIRGDGEEEAEEDLARRTRPATLWGEEETEWKSIRPVSRRRAQPSFSDLSTEWE